MTPFTLWPMGRQRQLRDKDEGHGEAKPRAGIGRSHWARTSCSRELYSPSVCSRMMTRSRLLWRVLYPGRLLTCTTLANRSSFRLGTENTTQNRTRSRVALNATQQYAVQFAAGFLLHTHRQRRARLSVTCSHGALESPRRGTEKFSFCIKIKRCTKSSLVSFCYFCHMSTRRAHKLGEIRAYVHSTMYETPVYITKLLS